MKQKLGRFFDIRSNEWERVILVFIFTLVMGIALVLLESIAETLFLKMVGPELIPLVMIPTSILRFISGLVYAAYADRIRNDNLYIIMFGIGSAALAACWFMAVMIAHSSMTSGAYIAYGTLFLLNHMFFNLSMMHANSYINGLFNLLESKRLYPLVSTGWRFGGILGGFGLSWAMQYVKDVDYFILVVAGLFAVCIVNILIIRLRVGKIDVSAKHAGVLRKLSVTESYKQGFNFIRNSSLLQTGAVNALFMVILLEIQYVQYNLIFSRQITSEGDLARFFLIFAGVSNCIGLVMQSVLVPRLVKSLGVGPSNQIFSICSILASVLLLFPTLPVGTYARFNHKIIKEAIKRPVTFMVYNPVPPEMRGRAQAFVQGFVLPIGTLMASGVLITCQKLQLSAVEVAGLSIFLAIGFAYTTYLQNVAYVKTLVEILHSKSVDLQSLAQNEFGRVSDKELAPLIHSLNDKDEHIAIFAAEVLGRVGGARAIKPLLDAVQNKPPSTQSAFIRVMGDLKDASIIQPLSEYLAHKDSRVRADTVEALGKQNRPEVVNLVKKLIFDPNNRVSANAVIVLARSGDKAMEELGGSVLEEMFISDDPNMRASAIYALGELSPDDAVKRITDFLRDPSDIVRYQACGSIKRLAKEPTKQLNDELCHLLEDKSRKVRMIAVETLNGAAMPSAIEPLKNCLIDPALKIRRNAAEALIKIGQPTFEELLPQLRSIDISIPLKEHLVIVLRKIDLNKARAEFLQLAQRELRTAYANCTLIAVLQQSEKPRSVELLIKAIEDKNTEIVSLCLRILESLGDPETIKVIERGLKYLDARSRANAIETLEHVGDKRIIRLLIPLLDTVSYDERAELALQTWNIKKRTLVSVIRHFVGSRDQWLRACSLFTIGEMAIDEFGPYVSRNVDDPDAYVSEAAQEAARKLKITGQILNGPLPA